MPIQQFTTYDLIVDTLPGAFLILVLIPLLPKEVVSVITGTKVAAAVVILGAGYVVGRLVHTIGPGFDDVDIPKQASTDDDMAWLVVTKLANRMMVVSSESCEKEVEEQRLEFIDANIGDIIKYGQSMLYRENTLYGRYEMLSTFFRNLLYAVIVPTILYLIWGVLSVLLQKPLTPRLSYSTAAPSSFYFIGFVLGLLIFGISKIGWDTFVDRKSDAFVHDVHQQLDLQYSKNPKAIDSD